MAGPRRRRCLPIPRMLRSFHLGSKEIVSANKSKVTPYHTKMWRNLGRFGADSVRDRAFVLVQAAAWEPCRGPRDAEVRMDTEVLESMMALTVADGTLAGSMGIKIVSASGTEVVATMPVAGNTQPFGLLHGGASCVLAETVGSLAAALHAGRDRTGVGIEISATRPRGARDGAVAAVATLAHGGRTLATYDIVITDPDGRPGVHLAADLPDQGRGARGSCLRAAATRRPGACCPRSLLRRPSAWSAGGPSTFSGTRGTPRARSARARTGAGPWPGRAAYGPRAARAACRSPGQARGSRRNGSPPTPRRG